MTPNFSLAELRCKSWISSSNFWQATVAVTHHVGASRKTMAGTLDRVRITTVLGVDTFDAGTINVSWE